MIEKTAMRLTDGRTMVNRWHAARLCAQATNSVPAAAPSHELHTDRLAMIATSSADLPVSSRPAGTGTGMQLKHWHERGHTCSTCTVSSKLAHSICLQALDVELKHCFPQVCAHGFAKHTYACPQSTPTAQCHRYCCTTVAQKTKMILYTEHVIYTHIAPPDCCAPNAFQVGRRKPSSWQAHTITTTTTPS